jgi:hypothetical protein
LGPLDGKVRGRRREEGREGGREGREEGSTFGSGKALYLLAARPKAKLGACAGKKSI